MPSPVLVGETMDMPLSAVDMSVDMADAGELNPGFLSQVHAGGIVSLALYHVPYLILPGARSLAAVHPALCKEPVDTLLSSTHSTGCCVHLETAIFQRAH